MTKTYEVATGTHVEVRKDRYTGLWNVWYVGGSSPKFAGPFKTKGEAVEAVERYIEGRAA